MLDDKFLTAKDLTAFFQVSRRKLNKWVDEGKAPSPVMIGGHPRWRNSDLQRFIANIKPQADEATDRA